MMNFNFKSLKDVGNFSGKKVLLRLDLNLAVVHGKVQDDFRIKKSVKTLEFLKSSGARALIVAHIESKETNSLKIVAKHLKNFIDFEFVGKIADISTKMESLKSGGFLLLENIRQNNGETENNLEFAKSLASTCDIYVNEAFSVSHREHASIVGVPKFIPSFAGFLFVDEVEHLSKAFNPPKPFVFLLAGAKFDTKFPLVQKFLKSADSVFIGGALANDLFKAKGLEIGLSKHTEKDFGFKEIIKNPKLILPIDVVVENSQSQEKKKTKSLEAVLPEDNILDSGPKTVDLLKQTFSSAKFILWNGTLGAYEHGFIEGTELLAKAIAQSGVESIVGGGDTLTAISNLNLFDKFSFVSTGGGAMLDFLANETLPGILALEESVRIKN